MLGLDDYGNIIADDERGAKRQAMGTAVPAAEISM